MRRLQVNMFFFHWFLCNRNCIQFLFLTLRTSNKYGSVTALQHRANETTKEGGALNQVSASLVRHFS
jgi:hypothetical protein